MENIRERVNGFKTKYKEGFVQEEIDELLKDYPNINMDKFSDAVRGITCMVIEGKVVIYHRDIELALKCGVEDRKPRTWEWD